MSNRKNIEKQIASSLSNKLSGFEITKSKLYPDNYFRKKISDSFTWDFSFYLYNKKTYSLFLTVWINYIDLTDILKKILAETNVSNHLSQIRICTTRFTVPALSIESMDEVDSFVNKFIDLLDRVEREYWQIYSNTEITMKEYMGNHVYWPISSLAQFVAYVVTYAIKNNEPEKIQFAVERGISMIESYNSERDRVFIETLKNKLIEQGLFSDK